jgi:HlyD family secretion protein
LAAAPKSLVAKDRQLSRRATALTAVGALFVYAIVMLWPYLMATLVRGSAVTAWTNLATAPIQGRAPARLPTPGATVGADGIIMEIVNDRLDTAPLRLADAELARGQARVLSAAAFLEAMQELDRDRRALMKQHAAHYRAELDAEIATRQVRAAMLATKAESATALARRTRGVADSGYRSRDYQDETQMRLSEAEADLEAERHALERLKRRRTAADDGLFLSADGASLDWAYADRRDAKTEVKRARLQLEQVQAEVKAADHALEAARDTYRLQHQAPVVAPPGSILRSVIVGNGATVGVGDPVAKWIDCRDLFVDAPVSDAALPLIPIGSRTDVILEGESRWRHARVAELRGAAETVGAADLAAIAKGRHAGDGQVLVKLEDEAPAFTTCPVGQAAYVHFPTAGLLDVLLARLGLR